MSTKDPFEDYVFSLSKDDFALRKDAITKRNNIEKYGASTVEDLALLKERPILCPACGSSDYIKYDHTANGTKRYLCKECGHTFLLVSKSIFNSIRIDFDILAPYAQHMSIKLPIEELCDISHLTALLWRHKIFATEYLKNMALISNLCSWLKRYLFRFIEMKKENLQAYLNWFVYLFRVKGNTEHWPKNERILRHLVLDSSRFTRG